MSKAAGYITAVINQKGGVAKTTTAHALSAGLILKGYSVLMIDMDAQGNFTHAAGLTQDEGPTIYGVLRGEIKAQAAIQHGSAGDMLISSRALAGYEGRGAGTEYTLRRALEPIRGTYDYIIIDTPPALGALTVQALTAASGALIPAQADLYSLLGIRQLNDTITAVQQHSNKGLSVIGLLLTRYNARAILSRDIADTARDMAQQMGTRLLSTTIREGIAVKEAQLSRRSLYEYAPRAKVTGDYSALVNEFIQLTGTHK